MATYSERANAWQLLLLVHRELNRVLGRELTTRFGLTLPFYEALFYINNAGEPGLQIGQLAESLALEASTATRFVDRMEKSRLVRRRQGTIDRRATYVVLTRRGRTSFEDMRTAYEEVISERFAGLLSAEEGRSLNRALDRVLAAARSNGTGERETL